MVKERQTISAEKIYSNQSVEEYGKTLLTILERENIDVIEMIYSPEKERFMVITKMNLESDNTARIFMEKKIRFIDKADYLEVASKSNTRYLV